MRVTVIPEDRTIIVNGRALVFDFKAPADLHALQWDGAAGGGHLEYQSGTWAELSKNDYQEVVRPYVEAFEAEAARLDSRPDSFHDWDQEAGEWRLNHEAQNQAQVEELKALIQSIEAGGERANREVSLALAEGVTPPDEALARLAEIESRIIPLRAQLQALTAEAADGE